MTRRLLLGLAVTLLVGSVLDATLHAEHVGRRSVGTVERERTAAGDLSDARPTLHPSGLARRWGEQNSNSRYELYLALNEFASGAVVVVDPEASLSPPFLLAIGGASTVRVVRPPEMVVHDAPVVASGTVRHGTWRGDWTIRAGTEPVAALVALARPEGVEIVDIGLLAPDVRAEVLDGVTSVTVGDVAFGPSRRAMSVLAESGVLLGLLLAGGLLLPRWLGAWRRVPTALVVGVALHGALGVLLIPGRLGPLATFLVAAAAGALLRNRGEAVGWTRGNVLHLVVAASAIVTVVATVQATLAVFLTPDSFKYWAGGFALASGELGPSGVDLYRGVGQQSLHAAGFALGAPGLVSLGSVLLLAAVALIVGTAAEGHGPGRPVLLGGVLLAATIVLAPQVRTMAAYLNSQVLLAVALLVLMVLLAHANDTARRTSLLPAVAAVIGFVVVTRAEGFTLIGLLLLGTLAVRGERTPWGGPWVALGLSMIVWATVLGLGGTLTTATVLLVAGGLGAIAFAALLPRLGQALPMLPTSAGVVLWAGTVGALLHGQVTLLEVAVANLGVGAGGWGVLAPTLLIATIAAIRLTTHSQRTDVQAARWFLIGFLPTMFITRLAFPLAGEGRRIEGLSDLLQGGGHANWGDSINRMWMHAVLIAVLLLLLALRDPTRGPVAADVQRRGADLALLALAGWVALQWQPAHVVEDQALLSIVVLDLPAGPPETAVVSGLVDGSVVHQPLALRAGMVSQMPETGIAVELCVRVPTVTLAGTAEGRLDLEVRRDLVSVSSVHLAADVPDWGSIETCLPVPDDEQVGRWLDDSLLEVVVSVNGTGSAPTPSILTAADASGTAFGATLAPAGGASGPIRSIDHLAMEVVVLHRPPSPPSAVLLVPWVILILGAASVLTSPRR